MLTKTPAIKPLSLSFTQIAKNFDEMSGAELTRHRAMADFDKFVQNSPERAAQLTFIDNLVSALKASNKYSDEQKARILAGALLDVKSQIAATYRWLNPDRSYVHANIDKVIGSQDSDTFDVAAKQACQDAFVDYVSEGKRLADVMVGVEKAHLLKFAFRMNPPVEAAKLSTAADLMRKMKPESRHHVVVKEKALDASHMIQIQGAWVDRISPKHYNATDPDADVKNAQIDTANRKKAVHEELKRTNKATLFDKARFKKVEPEVTNEMMVLYLRRLYMKG